MDKTTIEEIEHNHEIIQDLADLNSYIKIREQGHNLQKTMRDKFNSLDNWQSFLDEIAQREREYGISLVALVNLIKERNITIKQFLALPDEERVLLKLKHD